MLFPAWPWFGGATEGVLHQSDRGNVERDVGALKAQRAIQGARLANASLEQIEKDPALQSYAMAVGQSIFGDNCATCHGSAGTGGKGYPNLRDDVWLWGGSLEDIQRTTLIAAPGNGTATILGNAGKARFNGVEAELTALVFEGLRVSMSGALIDPKYVSYSDLSGDRSFERFTNIAKSSWTIAGDYTTDVGSAKVKLRLDYSWLAAQDNAEYNWVANPLNNAIIQATTADAVGTLGARASVAFHDGQYELAAYGRNLTNNRGYNNSLLVAPLGYISSTRREPITYGLTGTVKF